MIVCLAASQAFAAYDFSEKTNAKMLSDMKNWTPAEWKENINALLETGDKGLIKRSLNVAEKAVSESKVSGVNAQLLADILGDNEPIVGDHLGSAPASLNDNGDDALNLRNKDVNKTSVQELLGKHPEYEDKYEKDLVEGGGYNPPKPQPLSKEAYK